MYVVRGCETPVVVKPVDLWQVQASQIETDHRFVISDLDLSEGRIFIHLKKLKIVKTKGEDTLRKFSWKVLQLGKVFHGPPVVFTIFNFL